MSVAAFLGIDWGTHSSKWACYIAAQKKYASTLPLHSSDITCTSGSLTFGSPLRGDNDGVRSLKSLLIVDPLGSSFWEGTRGDTHTSLGEAVSFSLCCLLAEALTHADRDHVVGRFDIGFSFPNWLVDGDSKSLAAARHFCEAVVVAVELACTQPIHSLPQPKTPFAVEPWRQMVASARGRCIQPVGHLSVERLTQTIFATSDAKYQWGFITESGAAGLPYLRAMRIEYVPGAPGLAKLLVVDVGAGSTDVGYMLRVRHRTQGTETLYYFPPASSLPVAGNRLTDELMRHSRAANQPITYVEAEARKLQQTSWTKLAFVEAWRSQIAQHVREYIACVPDERWLPLPVTLNIVLTGGSGLVPGLKEAVKAAVAEALVTRRVQPATAEKLVVVGEHLPRLRFDTESEYARRAVCLGASDSDRPGCTYIASMDPPFKMKYEGRPRWV